MEKRTLTALLRSRVTTSHKSIMLIGPRQTGKSTLLKEIGSDLTIDLSDEAAYLQHIKDPSLIRAQAKALGKNARIMVDEIQRIPSMLNTIQSLIDGNQQLRFLLTGSSARKLRRGHANLLPGRLFHYEMFPLTYWELKEKWDLSKALTIGTLPEIYLTDYGPELLANYISSYLREEIQAEALIRNIATYSRFLDLAAETSGQIVNYSSLASDSEIPKETLRRYFDILSDTLLVHRLTGYTAISGNRKAIQKERFQFFDMGVRNAVLGQHRNVFSSTQLGSLFEQWFICQIFAYKSYYQKDFKLYFYRDDLKQEVDLVIDCGKELLAIEIKYSEKYQSSYIESLSAFSKISKKPVRSVLIYRGDTKQLRDDVVVWPYQQFLDELVAGRII